MTEERPIGSLALTQLLAEDPFGTVHRGLEWMAPQKTREVLVRTYHPHWMDQGLRARHHEIRRALVHMGHLKPFQGCHASRDGDIRLVWPLALGRSLVQTLERARSMDIAFGIDQALYLIWALSHHLRHLHKAGLPAGILAPHRIWIGFDGWVQLLDVPVTPLLREALASDPRARATVRAYLQGPAEDGVARDAFQLGALLYELLTGKPLPEAAHHGEAVEQAHLADPESGSAPVPEAIRALLHRLLERKAPFRTLEDLEKTMEASLFHGEFEPTTFGLAFTMQTLFREEIAQAGMTLEPEGLPEPRAAAEAPAPRRWRGLLAASGLAIASILGFGVYALAQANRTPQVAPPVSTPAPGAPRPVPASVDTPVRAPAQTAPIATSAPVAPSPLPPAVSESLPVRLRVFVDEEGQVRQAHLLSGAAEGSDRERKAFEMAMNKRFDASRKKKNWEEITVLVP